MDVGYSASSQVVQLSWKRQVAVLGLIILVAFDVGDNRWNGKTFEKRLDDCQNAVLRVQSG